MIRIGAWTRPWSPFGLEAALEHIRGCGFGALGLMTAGTSDDGCGSLHAQARTSASRPSR